jgi:hypothetical protein
MADWGLRTIGRWTAVAACVTGLSLAYARAHSATHDHPRPASISFRQTDKAAFGGWFAHSWFDRQSTTSSRADPHYSAARINTGFDARFDAHTAAKSASARPNGHPRPARVRRLSGLPPMGAGGIAYRPVSESARGVPRASGNTAYMRAGSIRDAVTRYNEERGTGRSTAQPSGAGARTPDPGVYRN